MPKIYNNIPEIHLSDLYKVATGYAFFVGYSPKQRNPLHCNPRQAWNILIWDMCYVHTCNTLRETVNTDNLFNKSISCIKKYGDMFRLDNESS
jgi:hypothetical protein